MAPVLSTAEYRRAQELAAGDGRISEALDNADAGVTQVLAAGPELVRWWEQAANSYGQAVITAAIDARRLGVETPVTCEFSPMLAPGT